MDENLHFNHPFGSNLFEPSDVQVHNRSNPYGYTIQATLHAYTNTSAHLLCYFADLGGQTFFSSAVACDLVPDGMSQNVTGSQMVGPAAGAGDATFVFDWTPPTGFQDAVSPAIFLQATDDADPSPPPQNFYFSAGISLNAQFDLAYAQAAPVGAVL
jgi:hypothetical protein